MADKKPLNVRMNPLPDFRSVLKISETDEYKEKEAKLNKSFFQDMMDMVEGRSIPPDTTGADAFFLRGFITKEMFLEFWYIAKDFLQHHFDKMREFDDMYWYDVLPDYEALPDIHMSMRILEVMYNAAKSGDEYSVELFKYLFKIYHKKEYKQLKRFSIISEEELFSLAGGDSDKFSVYVLAVNLQMCLFMGIELKQDCSFIYRYLNKCYDDFEKPARRFFEVKEEVLEQAKEQAAIWAEDTEAQDKRHKSGGKKFWEVDKFVVKMLHREGYTSKYVRNCGCHTEENVDELIPETLALLKSTFPDREFTYEEVQLYAHITEGVQALLYTCESTNQNMKKILGIDDDCDDEDYIEPVFNPDDINFHGKTGDKAARAEEPKNVPLKPVENVTYDETDLITEIQELRQRLSMRERENRNLKDQYGQLKKKHTELSAEVDKYREEHGELVNLRNYVYELSENADEVTDLSEPDIEKMKAAVSNLRITIIGGNDNWIKKLKQEFPDWKFVRARVSGTIERSSVQKADKVYFFTDTLGHSNYYKFMQVVRECEVPYGYMHGVSIEANVRQIYRDMV
jgi:hypothetical protein